METSKKIAVAGGTGRVGHHVVDALNERGYEAVPMSRATGVDIITGEGLAEALAGVDTIIDAATGPSPDEKEATDFFLTATRNLQEAGQRAGVKLIVVVSIIGTDSVRGGYNAAKLAHERAMLEGPIPVRILRAAQFHEFVGELVNWGRQGKDLAFVPKMRTQIVAARTVAEALVDLATDDSAVNGAISEIAGPREEKLVDLARKLMAHEGDPVQVLEGATSADPDDDSWDSGILLPGPDAKLAGPTFDEWLEAVKV
jgi:uncharacterized protein YbjT (DUF2867 family)